METRLPENMLETPEGREAEAILRSCVHCGFCNATCPTYQILGDELDGPRGRIYLMKQMLEGQPVTEETRLHLDRCLTCRNCETTCPSGVKYGRLLEIGREMAEHQVPRTLAEAAVRFGLRKGLTQPLFFKGALKIGQSVRGLLPAALRNHFPPVSWGVVQPGVDALESQTQRQAAQAGRKMLLLEGCVQPALSPEINLVAQDLLARLGVELIASPRAGCCGAIDLHLSAKDAALEAMRRNIDAWWPQIESGAEAIVITASGCGSVVKDYGVHLQHDPDYAEKARRVSGLAKDVVEILANEDLSSLKTSQPKRIAFHPPCSLQHGQKITGKVEKILTGLGHELLPFAESHLCCGSAGTYSLLQPEISSALKARKLGHLQGANPDVIATANIGCQTHLASGTAIPVVHWIQLLA